MQYLFYSASSRRSPPPPHPSIAETVETLHSLLGLKNKPTRAAVNPWGCGLFSLLLCESPPPLCRSSFSASPSAPVSLEIAAASRLCPCLRLRLQHLIRIFAPWFILSQERLWTSQPPRKVPLCSGVHPGLGTELGTRPHGSIRGPGAEGRSLRRVWEEKQRPAFQQHWLRAINVWAPGPG